MTEKAFEMLHKMIEGGIVDVQVLEYEDKPFAIVSDWQDVFTIGLILYQFLDGVDMPSNDYDSSALDALFPWSWGFSDEWDSCPHCMSVIRTSPDSYGWTPDYWLSEYDFACGDCVRSDLVDEYLDWLLYKAQEGEAVGCHLLNPDDHGFTLIVERMRHGLFDGMNDDPREIVKWGSEHGLQIIFTVRPSQFYSEFDVWARSGDGEPLEPGYDHDLRNALVDAEGCLRREFRQWPTPAQLMKEGLRNPVVHKVSAEDFIAGKALDHGIDAPVVQIVIEYKGENDEREE